MLTALGRKATGGVVLVSLTLWLGYSIALFQLGPYNALHDAIGEPMLEETYGYGAAEVLGRLSKLSDEGRGLYARFQLFDIWAAILLALALTLALSWVFARWSGPKNPLRYLVVVPLLLAVAEIVEDLLLILLLTGRATIDGPISTIAGIATAIKLTLVYAGVPFLVLSLVGLGFRRIARKNQG